MNESSPSHPTIEEDEIDLRELFATIGRDKKFIIIFTLIVTLLVAIKVYFMPKFYQSTMTIEVKSEDGASQGFSLGGAGALLGLGGGGASSNLEKDVTLLKTFRTNEKVLDKSQAYMVRYFQEENLKEVEVDENLSIAVSDVVIPDFKNHGMRLIVKPSDNTHYKLYTLGRFFDNLVGQFGYGEKVSTEDFSLTIDKIGDFEEEYTIQLSGTKRYVYKNIINDNLTIEVDKSSPFLTISYLDTLPQRGEAYLQELIDSYKQLSIADIREDLSFAIDSYTQQLKSIDKRVKISSAELEKYKSSNSIIQPKAQATILVNELSKVGIQIKQNNYQQELLTTLIGIVTRNSNVDAIAPSLAQLGDASTVSLIGTIQELQLQKTALLMKYKAQNPKILTLDEQISSLKQKVLSNLKNLQTTLVDKKSSLLKMESEYNTQLTSAPQKEQELISLSRDYQVNSGMYTYLMQEKSKSELQRDKALSRFRVIESIYTDDKAVKPKKALIVVVAFITSIILGIFIAFFREFMRKEKGEE